ncbi:XRE family transcriptional regulator [Acidobacteria bacterium AH-259-D05]|nr:XRE family transcriptional regulator [Acidobacteria bacterium AH-259-D05]
MNYLKRMGNNFRGILNDLKRNPKAAAEELGVTEKQIEACFSGEEELPHELIKKAVEIWPVNERDFYVVHDDAPDGVRIMRSSESMASARVFQRKGSDYYEYRDTAMSRLAMFRPEWIRELCVVEDDNPYNKEVQWNNGHFMHQFTYFIGPVNFYYEIDGERYVACMNTSDSMYITPFVPHTFATRKNAEGEKALILAITCGEKLLGDAQNELSAIGSPLAENYVMDFSTRERILGKLLYFYRTNMSISSNGLAELANIDAKELERFEEGSAMPDQDQLKRLAKTLKINRRDLLPPDCLTPKVVIQRYDTARRWTYSQPDAAYEVTELATTPVLPHSRALELNVLKDGRDENLDIKVGLHQYCYNLSINNILFFWLLNRKTSTAILEPGDSLYIKPYMEHSFRSESGGREKLLVMRIGGKMAGDPIRELSTLGREATRAIQETMQWYHPEGRN